MKKMPKHKNKGRFLASLSLFLATFVTAMSLASGTVHAQNYSAKCSPPAGEQLNVGNCGIVAYVQLAINILTAVIGVIIVIMIAVGGVQYSLARDNPQQTAAAKAKIYNAILALIIYLFSFAILQYLIPGGAF